MNLRPFLFARSLRGREKPARFLPAPISDCLTAPARRLRERSDAQSAHRLMVLRYNLENGRVVKLAATADSKSAEGNFVSVRVRPRPPSLSHPFDTDARCRFSSLTLQLQRERFPSENHVVISAVGSNRYINRPRLSVSSPKMNVLPRQVWARSKTSPARGQTLK